MRSHLYHTLYLTSMIVGVSYSKTAGFGSGTIVTFTSSFNSRISSCTRKLYANYIRSYYPSPILPLFSIS